jgi:leader peptidase (prepilin peptidase) / N-methyltransferase
MTDPILLAIAALLGASIGSFLNVCIVRLPEGLSVVAPRSRCPRCGAAIGWRDNVPILSWLLLRGRCRGCALPISPLYPLVELATALIWLGAAWWLGISWGALSAALFLTLLLGIGVTDARTYTIPDAFSLGGLALGLALAFTPGGIDPMRAALGAATGLGLLWALGTLGEWAFRRPALGAGDVKMMAMAGAFVGPLGVLLTLFLGALVGTLIFGPISLRTGKLVPFGIFLAVGAAVTLLFGEAIVGWYAGSVLGL